MRRWTFLLILLACFSCKNEVSRHVEQSRQEEAQREALIGLENYLQKEQSKNAIGTEAADFPVWTRGMKESRLSELRGKHVLMLFYSPDCEHCKAAIEAAAADEELQKLLKEDKLTVFAVDVTGDRGAWTRNERIIPEEWCDAIIASESFIEDRPYALGRYPAIYLIDPEGLVILKDETDTDSAVAAVLAAVN